VAAEPSERELRLLRMRSQRLLAGEGEKTVAGAASAALTIRAQDVRPWPVRARTNGLTAAAGRTQAARKTACRAWSSRARSRPPSSAAKTGLPLSDLTW
jgi:hypothetical protein